MTTTTEEYVSAAAALLIVRTCLRRWPDLDEGRTDILFSALSSDLRSNFIRRVQLIAPAMAMELP